MRSMNDELSSAQSLSIQMVSKKIFCCLLPWLMLCWISSGFLLVQMGKQTQHLSYVASQNSEEQIPQNTVKKWRSSSFPPLVVDGLTTNENGIASLSFKPTKWWKTQTSIYFRFVQNYRFWQNTTTAAMWATKTTKTMKKYFIVRLCASRAVAVCMNTILHTSVQKLPMRIWDKFSQKTFCIKNFLQFKNLYPSEKHKHIHTTVYVVREWLRGRERV